jgi:hypothetical protein
MRAFLLGFAAPLAALALPAAGQAQAAAAGPVVSAPGVSAQNGVRIHRDGKRHDRRGPRRSGDTVVIGGWGAPEAWGLYNNRSLDPESFNDWWHERPWRAYPRWVRQAPPTDCDRLWWGGGAWRCSW